MDQKKEEDDDDDDDEVVYTEVSVKPKPGKVCKFLF